MNGSTVSQPRAIELDSMCTHTHTHARTHTLAPTANSTGPIFSLPLCHYGNPPSPPLPHTGTITPTTVLSSVILWAVRKRYWSMTERNGLSGWMVKKENTFKRTQTSVSCLQWHLGKGVCVCVCEGGRATFRESIHSVSRNTVNRGEACWCFCRRTTIACMHPLENCDQLQFMSSHGVNTTCDAFTAYHGAGAQRDHSVSTVISSLSYLSLLEPWPW